MEKDKSKGLRHVKNKQKYKGNSSKKPEYVHTKTSGLESNWDRYKEKNEEPVHERMDFYALAEAPIVQRKYFQFKEDKALAEDVEIEKDTDLCRFNLNALQKNIRTVPFYERLNIPKEIFSKRQICLMDADAKKARDQEMHEFAEDSDEFNPFDSDSDEESTQAKHVPRTEEEKELEAAQQELREFLDSLSE